VPHNHRGAPIAGPYANDTEVQWRSPNLDELRKKFGTDDAPIKKVKNKDDSDLNALRKRSK